MASYASSSLWEHDVFLSFCGKDTRRSFVSHLYKELTSLGIKTFKDDKELDSGTCISDELIGAIRGSKFAIVVISKNYAFSSWCLQELTEIIDCSLKGSLTVTPIFYDVDPSDVRNLREQFGEAVKKHEESCREDVGRWRKALTRVANLVGLDSNNRNYKDDVELIQKVSRNIWDRLNLVLPDVDNDLVGMDVQMKKMEPLLDVESCDEVRVIGICGMGGIGKTTVARYIYEKFCHQFENVGFFANVKEVQKNDLQKHFLSIILGVDLSDSEVYSKVIKARLGHRKVLTILDDIDNVDQMYLLVRKTDWFGQGSRIIMTSRDRGLFENFQEYEIKIHQVEVLDLNDAAKLFSRYAFGQESPKDGFLKLSNRSIIYACGLPLALKVLGSHLSGKSKEEWEMAQHEFKENPPKDIINVLKISYDLLDKRAQDIFLYLACCFRQEKLEDVTRILNHIYSNVEYWIKVLVSKSLVHVVRSKIGVQNVMQIDMHDLLQEMGREVNRQLSIDHPGKRKLLTEFSEANDVLKDTMGTKTVEAIHLVPKDDLILTGHAFKKMVNLRILIIDDGGKKTLVGEDGLNYLPRKLVLLRWEYCPLHTMPPQFYPEYLAELELRGSELESLWEGTPPLKNLKKLDLSYSRRLKTIASLSNAQNLRKSQIYSKFS